MKTKSNFGTRTIFVIASLGFLVGLYGLYDRVVAGHVNANYGSYVPWGLWVAGYIYFIGFSAGAFLMSTLYYVFGIKQFAKVAKLALFTALITLFGAMLLIFTDLGHPLRVWKMMFQTNFTSVMGWMFWFYSTYFILLSVELWLALRADLVAASGKSKLAKFLTFGRTDVSERAISTDHRLLRILGSLGVPLAILFPGGVGALFGVVGARPFWNSGITPIIFLVGALLSGGGLLTFLYTLFGQDRGTDQHRKLVSILGLIILGLLAFYVLLEWSEYSIVFYSAVPAHADALSAIFFGPYWWVFWFVHVALGIVIPALLLIFARKSVAMIATAGLLIAITFLSVRLNIVIPALNLPEIAGLERAYAGPGLAFNYFPSVSEWLFAIWVASLAALLFLLGLRLLPIATSATKQQEVA
jgi:molybdopterin-containing oxidoreductase family membrane subunit